MESVYVTYIYHLLPIIGLILVLRYKKTLKPILGFDLGYYALVIMLFLGALTFINVSLSKKLKDIIGF